MRAGLSPRQLLLLAAALAASFLVPGLVPAYFLYVANLLMMDVVLALGLGLLIGWSGQFAFAHMAFFGIGIYGTALLDLRLGIPFPLAMPAAAALAGLVGCLIAVPATRLRTVYLALATFAFAQCAQWIFQTWTALTGGVDGLRIRPPEVFGRVARGDAEAFPLVATIMLVMLAATLYLTRSRLGRHLCTIRDSEHVAAASGIDVKRTKVTVFAISAIYAGIAGGMYTLFHSFVNPELVGVDGLVVLLTMVVVGGSGSIAGIVLGVVLMGLVPEALRAAPKSLLAWQEFFYGAILIVAVMFMPLGIWGAIGKLARRARKPARRAAARLSTSEAIRP
jgi:branched-chain amino acid transport system permease protein